MINTTYYIDFSLEHHNPKNVMAQILKTIHAFYKQTGKLIPVAFPSSHGYEAGTICRLFNDIETLCEFTNLEFTQELLKSKYLHLKAPIKTPTENIELKSYIRNRKAEKNNNSTIKSNENRAIIRSTLGINTRIKSVSDIEERRKNIELKAKESNMPPMICLGITSSSQHSTMSFLIEKSDLGTTSGDVNSYGLALASNPLLLPHF